MSLSLPSFCSPLREAFEVSDLVSWRKLPYLSDVVCRKHDLDKGVISFNSLVIKADGEIWLIEVGKRGGWKKLWNFGKPE